jgi:histidyl-tRNA synthetase
MTRDTITGDELLRKASAVGQYYGFTPLSVLTAANRGAKKPAGKDGPDAIAGLSLDPIAESVAAFLKQCRATGQIPSARQPLFVWHTNIAPGRPSPKKAVLQFHAIGSDRAIADAVVIRALFTLVRDLYHDEPVIRINSMGDKETRARYARELGNFFKKRAAVLPEECVSCAKRDAIEAAEMAWKRECAEDLPAPTDHLSDASRKRFEDLLEYLEETETAYELARDLISRGSAWSETCFELVAGGKRVAWGSRYGDLARHFFPGALPAVGGVVHINTDGADVSKASQPRTRFAFVHIGDEAKRFSIRMAEEFKKARVPLTQDIGIESLAEQLHLAERRNPAYLVIMGRKEALEGSVILRNRTTQDESVLSIDNLAERLKAFA